MDLNNYILEKMFIKARKLNNTVEFNYNCNYLKIDNKICKYTKNDTWMYKILYYDDIIVELEKMKNIFRIFYISKDKNFYLHDNEFYTRDDFLSNYPIKLDRNLYTIYDDLPKNIYEWTEEDLFFYNLKYCN